MLTFGSLFAGIGGMDLGLERAGMRCVWQVEIDDWCRRVLAKHWPDVPKWEDVRDVGRDNLAAVDVIAGGFPCQPHSLAGKRRGQADDRYLWPEFFRIVTELRPRYVLAENVPGIITTALDAVLSDLEGADYATRTVIVPACAVDAPHRRDRVFIVAYAEGERTRSTQQPGCWRGTEQGGKVVAYAGGTRLAQRQGERGDSREEQQAAVRGGWWAVEPDVGRVAHGVPARVDRLRGLGNAVVPQVAQWLGEMIVAADEET